MCLTHIWFLVLKLMQLHALAWYRHIHLFVCLLCFAGGWSTPSALFQFSFWGQAFYCYILNRVNIGYNISVTFSNWITVAERLVEKFSNGSFHFSWKSISNRRIFSKVFYYLMQYPFKAYENPFRLSSISILAKFPL